MKMTKEQRKAAANVGHMIDRDEIGYRRLSFVTRVRRWWRR